MDKYTVLLEGCTPITILAYDYHYDGEWVTFRDCMLNRIAIVNARKLIAIFPVFETEGDEEGADDDCTDT